MSFNPLSFDYSRYEQDNTVYDEELPYFSVVVKTIVLERYSAYLRKKKESKVQAEMQPQQKEPQPIQDKSVQVYFKRQANSIVGGLYQ